MTKAVQEIVADLRKADMSGAQVDTGAIADQIELAFAELEDKWRQRVEAARHSPGNAAAMREALVFLRDKELFLLEGNVRCCVGLTVFGLEQVCKIMRGLIEEALAAPARNCDRFADELDAQLAFLNEVWWISVDRETMLDRDKYENWSDEMRTRYGRWLLVPVAEREGAATDGKA